MTTKTITAVVMGMTMLVATLMATPAFSAMSSDIMVTRTSQMEPAGIYVGGAFGNADYDKFGESDVGFSLYGGIKPWNSLGFELAYVNFGNPSSAGTDLEVTAFKAGVVASSAVKIDFSVFGQVGLAIWDSEVSPGSFSESGSDIYFGFGALKTLSGRSSLRFAVDFYSFSSTGFDEDVTFISIGFQQGL